MLWLFKSAGARNSKNKQYQFWRQDNQSKELETNHFKDQKLEYIHNNPVDAGIVYSPSPEQYIYSSAIDYAGGKGLIEINIL